MRRLTLAGAAGLVVALAAFATPAVAAPSGGGCLLQGTASFSPGLSTSSQPFGYSFTGKLSNCQSSVANAPASGTVTAGEPITIGGVTYQEPPATGSGGCASSTTAGTAFVQWADGTLTIVKYTTTGAAAAVVFQGSVLPSVVLGSTTVTSTRYVGASSLGLLAFQPPDPTACNTSAGVTSAGISGFIGLGSAS